MTLERGYLVIDREWSAGDVITLELPMPAERNYAHPSVSADLGRVALQRGPLVYCLEHADHADQLVQDYRLPPEAEVAPRSRSDLFGGIVTLEAKGTRLNAAGWDGSLYRFSAAKSEPATLTAVPYYLWNNRGPGSMLVWIPEA